MSNHAWTLWALVSCYYPGKEVGQAFQPDKAQSQAGKPDLHAFLSCRVNVTLIINSVSERIELSRFPRFPGGTPMATAEALLTAEEFGRRPDPGHLEELVQGRIITMPPPQPRHGQVCVKVIRILDRMALGNL